MTMNSDHLKIWVRFTWMQLDAFDICHLPYPVDLCIRYQTHRRKAKRQCDNMMQKTRQTDTHAKTRRHRTSGIGISRYSPKTPRSLFRLLSTLDHPNIVSYHNFYESSEALWPLKLTTLLFASCKSAYRLWSFAMTCCLRGIAAMSDRYGIAWIGHCQVHCHE